MLQWFQDAILEVMTRMERHRRNYRSAVVSGLSNAKNKRQNEMKIGGTLGSYRRSGLQKLLEPLEQSKFQTAVWCGRRCGRKSFWCGGRCWRRSGQCVCVKEEEEETWEKVRTTTTTEWISKAGFSKAARRGEPMRGLQLWAAESLPQWLLPWGSSSALACSLRYELFAAFSYCSHG